jgi:sugar diacid utilization regulator
MNKQEQIVHKIVEVISDIKQRVEFKLSDGRLHLCQCNVVTVTTLQTVPFSIEECPAVLVADSEAKVLSQVVGYEDHQLKIVLTTFVALTDIDSVRPLLADMLAALGRDITLGGLVFDIVPLSRKIEMNQTGEVLPAAELVVQVNYRTDRWGM